MGAEPSRPTDSPELEERLERLLDSFVERFRRGERPSVTEYLRRHPDLASRILEVFPATTFLGDLRRGGSAGSRPDAAPEAVVDEPLSAAGLRLGEYGIVRELGRGGMGVVYEAEQESLGRRVALKVLPFHALTDPRLLERFRREARAAARLRHPRIVPVFGFGESGGVHYYTMQLVEGAGLDRVVRELRRLRVAGAAAAEDGGPEGAESVLARSLLGGDPRRGYFQRIARLGKDVAEALAYAHGEGVLHRDIKPSNLLLDSGGNVWVTDFGLAKAEDAEDLTSRGEILGTLRYLAPESLGGTWDRRSDVYSLGVTLHELLALEPAFPAQNRADLLREVTSGTPRRLREIDRDVPCALERIVLKASSRDPLARYPSAEELAADLGRFLDGRPVAVRLPFLDRRSRRIALLRRGLVVGTVGLAVTLSVLGALALFPARPLKPQDLLLEDVDGDGRIDMVVANSGDNTDRAADSIAILLGRGGGAFGRPSFVPVGDLPLALARADVDGDGAKDLLFADSTGISLLGPEGRGSWAPRRLVPLQATATALAASDLDGDGNADLAAVFHPSSDVALFWGSGSGSFPQRATVTVGRRPYFLGVADLDGDGKDDLVTTNGWDTSGAGQEVENVSIVRNRGGRSFAAAVHLDLGEPALGVAIDDLDGDGHDDIAVARGTSFGLAVFRNDGHGGFPGRPALWSLPSAIWTLASADLDGDGDRDLVGAGGAKGAYWLRNDPPGVFSNPVALPTGTRPAHVKAADLDGDADLDLAITNLDSDDVTVHFGDGSGGFDRTESISLEPWFRRLLR